MQEKSEEQSDISLMQFSIKNISWITWHWERFSRYDGEKTNFYLCFFFIVFVSINLPRLNNWPSEVLLLIITLVIIIVNCRMEYF